MMTFWILTFIVAVISNGTVDTSQLAYDDPEDDTEPV